MLRIKLLLFCGIILSQNSYAQNLDEFFNSSATIGGYGELHYNYKKPESGQTSKILDFHRFVLFFGYNFTESWSFRSEIELEHNLVDGESGELELEQAYVNYSPAQYIGARAGVVLNSVGLLNEVHEPPTFFGVERPEYQKVIIPTTWFGNGGALFGYYKGFDYIVTVMEGLDADKLTQENISKDGIRSARSKGFKSNAHSMLVNGRVNYSGIKGLLVGGSYSYNNAIGDSLYNKIGVAELHLKFNINSFYLTGEVGNISYSEGDIQSSFGYYVDVGYDIGNLFNLKFQFIPFFRFTNYNTVSSSKSGGDLEKANNKTRIMGGLHILPIPQVSLKADYGIETIQLDQKKTTYFNLGIGYMF